MIESKNILQFTNFNLNKGQSVQIEIFSIFSPTKKLKARPVKPMKTNSEQEKKQ